MKVLHCLKVGLLGVALGLTAGAHLAAAIIGLILAAFFLLYLAPGRRMAAAGILFISGTIGVLILWGLYGFGAEISKIFAGNHLRLQSLRLNAIPPLEALPLMMLLSLALVTFLAWRRTR